MPDHTSQRVARIIGVGSYLPEKILTNADLEKMVETSDEWIVTRTGIKERRIARSDEFTSDMGVAAAEDALKNAHLDSKEIDLIIFATLTPDYIFPSTAALLQKHLGATHAAAFDVQAACTGYIYGLSIAKAFIESGIYKNILLVAAEKLSSIVNYKDRNTCVLFGDGAAAAVISDKGEGFAIRHTTLGADGEQASLLMLPAGGSRNPASKESVEEGLHYILMEGKEVFKHAVRRMESAAEECIAKSCVQESDITWFVPHQANLRIIEALAKRFSFPSDRVYKTLQKYGNTSASSVGIALHELLKEHEIKEGENLLLAAFGAGLTWGATILSKITK
ncbi:MAG: ketoacyl-ACP synthase III [Chlamydiales bacterium]|nr:ketoacyl-ACP synthase III [Chlamydiales bacterium]